ncbi:MAG: hypothetical protein QOF78_4219 [Phycisphaerales bacterium]|jgi:hypothetical protein|nr:hypothetical protein [Phycisphaerales bacterium]
MGLRETLNENPRIVTGITVGIIVVVLAVILWPSGGAGGSGGGGGSSQAFFTIDDGKNYFPDDAKKVPPFQKDGKEAVRAVVYQCGGAGGKPFVNHLIRYTPDGKKRLESAAVAGKSAAQDPTVIEEMEVKPVGGKEWMKMTDPKANAAIQPKCPNGGTDAVEVGP